MDLKKFYDSVGGSYEEIKNRLPTDKLIEKFVLTQKSIAIVLI